MLRLLLIYLISFLTCFKSAQANTHSYGVIVKLRGDVTVLHSGAKKAVSAKMHMKLFENSSILTKKSSLVRIRLKNKTTITLGPNSKINLKEIKPVKSDTIDLISGRIRTKVEELEKNKKQDKDKLKIVTRSAALGVRGTEFYTIYNFENKNTSVITLKGAVELKEETVFQKKPKKKMPQAKNIPAKEKKSVTIKEGKYASIHHQKQEIIKPTRISPLQLNVLKNLEKEEKEDKEDKKEKEKEQETISDLISPEEETSSLIAGGFVDLGTGIYVPPKKSGKFDEKNKVYLHDKKQGNIDLTTGEYVPPKGLKLDSFEGFIIDKKKVLAKNNLEELKELENRKRELNQYIPHEKIKETKKKRIIEKKEKQKKSPTVKDYYAHLYMPWNIMTRFSYHFVKEKLDLTNRLNSSSTKESYSSSDGTLFDFLLKKRLHKKYSVNAGLEIKNIHYKDTSGTIVNNKKTYIGYKIGVSYYPRYDVALNIFIERRPDTSFEAESSDEVIFNRKNNSTYFVPGVQYSFYKTENLFMNTGLLGFFELKHKRREKGIEFSLGPSFLFEKDFIFDLNLSHRISQTENTNASEREDTLDRQVTKLGFQINLRI